jgi:hypothetical protein
LAEPGLEHKLIQFSLARQRERIPATIPDVIDYLAQKSIIADRWWVARFVECHEAELTVQKASPLEHSRHEVAPNDVERYFGILREECQSIPSLFGWNVDETPVGSPKQTVPPNVIAE